MTFARFPARTPVDHEVVIVGAGFSGVGQAIALKRAGMHDFVLLEKSSGVAGTWRQTTYPGIACDIPSHLYCFSYEPYAGWTRKYAPGAEIQEYLRRCVAKYYVEPHLRRNTVLLAARFDEPTSTWELSVGRGDDDVYELRCRSLVLALGGLHVPAVPDIPGLLDFPGPVVHTGAWDPTVPIAGKRVALIGTGASGAQVAPAIADQVSALTVYQRTPAWVLPKNDGRIGALSKVLSARLPALMRVRRAATFWRLEALVLAFTRFPRLLGAAEARAARLLNRQVPDPVVRQLLTPTDRLGCRRVVLSDDYLPVFALPHVRLDPTPVTAVDRSVVVSSGARTEVDVIVLATGFVPGGSYQQVEIVGAGGRRLHEQWGERPEAYYGVMVEGFPNMFTVLGPNSGLGHSSVLAIVEAQNTMIVRAMWERDRRDAASVQVRGRAQAHFNSRLQQRSASTVWTTGCRSWYLDPDGTNRALWPWSTLAFQRRTRVLQTNDLWFGAGSGPGEGSRAGADRPAWPSDSGSA